MPNTKPSYPEIESIQEDLYSLKTDIADLARHVKDDGVQKAALLNEKIEQMYASLKVQGAKELKKAEKTVRDKPLESVAIAFAAGLLASFLFGRKP